MPQSLNVVLAINDAQYSQAIERARKGIKNLQRDMESSGHATVSSMQASSAAIRTLEGNLQNNIRATERFISMIPGVGAALQAAFPVIGAIAFLGVIKKVGDEFVETVNKAKNAGDTIRNAFSQSTLSTQEQNAALELTNEKLQDQIDKIKGVSGQNALKEQLIESRIEALKLASALDSDAAKMQALIKENGVGITGQISAGLLGNRVANTNSTTGNLDRDAAENQSHAYDISQAELTKNPATIASAVKSATDALQRQINGYEKALSDFNKLSVGVNAHKYDANKAFLQGAIQQNQGQLTALQDRQQNSSLTGALGTAEDNQAAKQAADKALAERLKFRDKMVETYRKEEADDASHVSEMSKIGDEWAAKEAESDNKVLAERRRVAAELEKFQDDLANIQRHGADSLAQQSIDFARNAGTLSAHNAALQTAALHTREYAQALADLQAQQRAADGVGDTSESQRVGRQIGELNANRGLQVGADQNAVANSGQFSDLVKTFNDFPTNLANVLKTTLNSFNDDILSGKGFKQTAQDALKGIGKAGLQKAEGRLFGIKTGKTGSNAGNPMFVKDVDKSKLGLKGGSGSALGGILGALGGKLGKLGSIAGSILGFADGGNIDPSMGPIIVGEEGPEVVTPKKSGTVVPNKKAFGGGGGDTHYHVDARHSQDPAATARMVYAAAVAAHSSSVRDSAEMQKQHKRRTPNVGR
jgi:hypothetical protein